MIKIFNIERFFFDGSQIKRDFIEISDEIMIESIKHMDNYNKFLTKTEKFFKAYSEVIGYKVTIGKDSNEENILGIPDFIIERKQEKIYAEIKSFARYGSGNSDGLRISQLRWFSENKDKNSWIIFINEGELDEIIENIEEPKSIDQYQQSKELSETMRKINEKDNELLIKEQEVLKAMNQTLEMINDVKNRPSLIQRLKRWFK